MKRVPTALAAVALIATASVGGVAARSTAAPGYQVANVGAYGGEPSIVSDTNGRLYDATPFGVDRDWVAASILSGTSTSRAEVVLMYHDFYGPSQIWVNISRDGGATFGPPQEVLAAPAVTPGAITGTVVAQGYTLCNTVPLGVGIVPPGRPHAGRIIVGWIAADLA